MANNKHLNSFMLQMTREIAADYDRARDQARKDPGTAGDQGELNWKTVLDGWLPGGYSASTKGRIINAKGEDSPQMDVVVFKPSYPPRMRDQLSHLSGGVAAAFECKLTLRPHHIEEAVKKAVALRKLLLPRKGSVERELDSGIMYGLLAHSSSWKNTPQDTLAALQAALLEADKQHVMHPREMLDFICISDLCFIAAVKASWLGPFPATPSMNTYGTDGAPATGYITHSRERQDDGTPVGAFLCNLIHGIALDDPSVRSMSAYLTMSGLVSRPVGCQFDRVWPASIYSCDETVTEAKKKNLFIKGLI